MNAHHFFGTKTDFSKKWAKENWQACVEDFFWLSRNSTRTTIDAYSIPTEFCIEVLNKKVSKVNIILSLYHTLYDVFYTKILVHYWLDDIFSFAWMNLLLCQAVFVCARGVIILERTCCKQLDTSNQVE